MILCYSLFDDELKFISYYLKALRCQLQHCKKTLKDFMVDMRRNKVSQDIQIWMLILYHNILINLLFELKDPNDYNNTNWFRHSLVLAAYITQTNFIFANNYMIVNCCNIFSNAHLLFSQKLKHLSIHVGYTIWHLFQPLVSYCNLKIKQSNSFRLILCKNAATQKYDSYCL